MDRSGAYAARYIAKNIVAAGIAKECEIQLAFVIGVARPVSVQVETFGTAALTDSMITELVLKHFDLRPASIIRDLDLRRQIYRKTAANGQFGRPATDLPWERTDKADMLAEEAREMDFRINTTN